MSKQITFFKSAPQPVTLTDEDYRPSTPLERKQNERRWLTAMARSIAEDYARHIARLDAEIAEMEKEANHAHETRSLS